MFVAQKAKNIQKLRSGTLDPIEKVSILVFSFETIKQSCVLILK